MSSEQGTQRMVVCSHGPVDICIGIGSFGRLIVRTKKKGVSHGHMAREDTHLGMDPLLSSSPTHFFMKASATLWWLPLSWILDTSPRGKGRGTVPHAAPMLCPSFWGKGSTRTKLQGKEGEGKRRKRWETCISLYFLEPHLWPKVHRWTSCIIVLSLVSLHLAFTGIVKEVMGTVKWFGLLLKNVLWLSIFKIWNLIEHLLTDLRIIQKIIKSIIFTVMFKHPQEA